MLQTPAATIIKSPAKNLTPASAAKTLSTVSALYFFKEPKRAQSIGMLDDAEAALFTQVMQGYHRDYFSDYLFIKGPGTDFYIPPSLNQFVPPLRKSIEHHYAHGHPGNRTGQEWCWITILQMKVGRMHELGYDLMPTGKTLPPGPQEHHIDAEIDDFVKEGKGTLADRYIVSSALPTAFFDYRLKIGPDDLARGVQDMGIDVVDIRDNVYWRARIRDELECAGAPAQQFPNFSIVHFDTSTPHAAINPEVPVRRTMMTWTFTSAKRPEWSSLNNPWLEAALKDRDVALAANGQGDQSPCVRCPTKRRLGC